jgi:glycine cleavage system H lipoate-binding protein
MYGYSDLASVEKNLNLAALNATETETATAAPKTASGLIILFSLIVAAGLIIAIAVRSRNKTKNVSRPVTARIKSFLDEKSMLAPAGLYFDKTHTWAFMEKDGIVRVGIDDFMQHLTGTITRIVMREPGEYVRRGEKIVTIIQEGKQLILYAPVSGKIRSQNTDLYIDSSLLNISPYADGWIYLIEPANWTREIQFMFMADKFGEWIRNEVIRFRDFLAGSVRIASPVYAHAIMQDGGELTDNPLEGLGPEVWEEFQTNFINVSK